jgi:hypothetical protein
LLAVLVRHTRHTAAPLNPSNLLTVLARKTHAWIAAMRGTGRLWLVMMRIAPPARHSSPPLASKWQRAIRASARSCQGISEAASMMPLISDDSASVFVLRTSHV